MLAPRIYDFSFSSSPKLKFKPGQYLEWTLPGVSFDRRGNRRTFSIASAPGETDIHIGIKTSANGSAYKRALIDLNVGDTIKAGQLAGDFLLPNDVTTKLTFIAGGIGITPFVSMVQHMINRQEKRDIVMFYLIADPLEYVYKDLWKDAHSLGLKVVPVLSDVKLDAAWKGRSGRLNEEVVGLEIPDYKERQFYLSGPNALVESYSALLLKLGVRRKHIITDHFSGY